MQRLLASHAPVTAGNCETYLKRRLATGLRRYSRDRVDWLYDCSHDEPWTEVTAHADRLMYDSRGSGRNRVTQG